MLTGTIILFKEDKGYGFIRPNDSDENVYVHVSAIKAAGIAKVEVGQSVSYEVLSENGKNSATNIKLID
jgi:CspA family cold shock protein